MIRRLQQFRQDSRAIAAVEFALIVPLLITLYLGTIEATMLYSADHKVATIASTMADLVSREKSEISTATLDTYFKAAETILRPYASAGLVQVVSLVKIDAQGVATVKWSRPHGALKGRDPGSAYPLGADAKINVLARGASGWLVAAEITYPHQPLFGLIFSNTITLKHTEYFLPRFNAEITLK